MAVQNAAFRMLIGVLFVCDIFFDLCLLSAVSHPPYLNGYPERLFL